MSEESDSGKPLMRLEGWQPIVSAPKDGTRILSYASGFDEGERWESYKIIYWEPEGFYASGPCFVDGYLPCGATHWHPLPSAPQGASQPTPPPEDGR